MADVTEGVGYRRPRRLDYVMSMFLPTDVDHRIADRHQFRVMLTASRKPSSS